MQDTDLSQLETLMLSADSRFYYIAKSWMDIIMASLMLVFISPVFAMLMLGVKLSSPGPIFYCSERHGKNGVRFNMIKFRTMVIRTEQQQQLERQQIQETGFLNKSAKDPRITPFGQFLRSSSLDELPQLINVALGQMSFIGPRPVMPEMTRPFPNFERARCLVKPGMTGLWQIRDRARSTHVSWMAHHDLEYIQHASLWLDIKILLLTIPCVLLRKGAC